MKTLLKNHFSNSFLNNATALGYDMKKLGDGATLATVIKIETHKGLTYQGCLNYVMGLGSFYDGFSYNSDIINLMQSCGYKTKDEFKLVEMYWDNAAKYLLANASNIKLI
jgi:hypothetical protein